jgi:anti-sigma regulatory factor (Ser/Thr protein kinase)
MTDLRQTFPSSPISAGQARRFVEDTLEDAGLDRFAYPATLLVSELVANAILHTGTPFTVVVVPGKDGVRVEVHDGSPELPIRKHYSKLSGTGRGLLLVERMAAGWGADLTSHGKAVWFELDGQSVPELDILGVEAI